jgi:hypothetical protein
LQDQDELDQQRQAAKKNLPQDSDL